MIINQKDLHDIIHYMKEFKYIDKDISAFDIEDDLKTIDGIVMVMDLEKSLK